jgi:hypothetical protein
VATQNEPVEELLLSRYIAANLEGLDTYVHLRLGQPRGYTLEKPAPPAVRQLFLSTLPEADLVVKGPTSARIYEFGIWRPQAKLGQLLVYGELLRSTPGFESLQDTDISLYLVQPQEDPQIEEIAHRFDVGYITFPDEDVLQKIAERRGGS